MPFDGSSGGERWNPEPTWRQCRSCKRPIAAHEPFEHVQFETTAPHRLHEANGTYHAACAKPILSLARALGSVEAFIR
jgi:hypothetical protein